MNGSQRENMENGTIEAVHSNEIIGIIMLVQSMARLAMLFFKKSAHCEHAEDTVGK